MRAGIRGVSGRCLRSVVVTFMTIEVPVGASRRLVIDLPPGSEGAVA
jgi:hypothetical protein